MGSTSPLLAIGVSLLLLEVPFWLAPFDELSPSPTSPMSSWSGMSFLESRAFCSAQARSFTKLRSRASLRAPWLCSMASLTLVAISFRRSGWRSGARDGARLSAGNIRRAKVLSRSSRNWGLVGARGASCVVANSSAGLMSPSGVDVEVRISSTSCSRNNAKCNAGFSSKI